MSINPKNRTTWAVAILAAAVAVLVGLGQMWATLEAPHVTWRLQSQNEKNLSVSLEQAGASSDTTDQLAESDKPIEEVVTTDPATSEASGDENARESGLLESDDGPAVHNYGVPDMPKASGRSETTSFGFIDGPQTVCGGLRIDAEPWYDESLGNYGKVRIILPNGSRLDHRIDGSAPTQITSGCLVASARIRYQRSNQPYAELTIIEETIR